MNTSNSITKPNEDSESFDDLILSRSEQRKLDFNKSLTSEPPSCPECHNIMRLRDLKKCNYCGFHFGYLEKIFPSDLPKLEDLTDFAHLFSKQEKTKLLKQLDTIQTRYPQLFIKVAILPLQPDVEIQQMAMWMLNNCPLPEEQNDADRLWTILLLIDSSANNSCIAEGYKAEVMITPEITLSLIQKANSSLKNHSVPETVKTTLHELLFNLDHSKKLLKKAYRSYKKRVK